MIPRNKRSGPGGGTRRLHQKARYDGVPDGAELGSTCVKFGVFARPECAVKPFKTTNANDNEAFAIAA